FPMGDTDVTAEGMGVLQRVGTAIARIRDVHIRVEGHTDNKPISSALRQKYPSNWELSTARATHVVHFLVDTAGMAPERIEAVGHAEYHPVADNESEEGRARNRRIEILLVPGRRPGGP
ncbi:MAG: flagellar motor protein MotB, partial [Lentisphaeria bacterium]|nr:flagellar motor protein MotB [Lentisphaeria bacterium]